MYARGRVQAVCIDVMFFESRGIDQSLVEHSAQLRENSFMPFLVIREMLPNLSDEPFACGLTASGSVRGGGITIMQQNPNLKTGDRWNYKQFPCVVTFVFVGLTNSLAKFE